MYRLLPFLPLFIHHINSDVMQFMPLLSTFSSFAPLLTSFFVSGGRFYEFLTDVLKNFDFSHNVMKVFLSFFSHLSLTSYLSRLLSPLAPPPQPPQSEEPSPRAPALCHRQNGHASVD